MREDQKTTAPAFASGTKVVPLHQAPPPGGEDHLTWAYQTHVTAIYQYIYSRVGNRPDAEDLTAQVFMKAISGMRSDVSVPELRSWLYRVAQTTLADHWREYYADDTGELDDDVTRPPDRRHAPGRQAGSRSPVERILGADAGIDSRVGRRTLGAAAARGAPQPQVAATDRYCRHRRRGGGRRWHRPSDHVAGARGEPAAG